MRARMSIRLVGSALSKRLQVANGVTCWPFAGPMFCFIFAFSNFFTYNV